MDSRAFSQIQVHPYTFGSATSKLLGSLLKVGSFIVEVSADATYPPVHAFLSL